MEQEKHDEVKLIFETAIEDIRFYKNQQWKVTYYGLLIYAVIYSSHLLLEKNCLEHSRVSYYSVSTFIITLFIILYIMLLSIWLLINLNNSIKLARNRIENCKELFGDFFKNTLISQSIVDKSALANKFMVMFFSVLILGAIIVITLICVNYCCI